jgi:hypothetical protein
MNQFLWGVQAALCGVAATFFWSFWKRTDDSLFRAFAAGFAALSVHWIGLGLLNPSVETRHYLYLVRLLAFVLFIAGVVSKNREKPRGGTGHRSTGSGRSRTGGG